MCSTVPPRWSMLIFGLLAGLCLPASLPAQVEQGPCPSGSITGTPAGRADRINVAKPEDLKCPGQCPAKGNQKPKDCRRIVRPVRSPGTDIPEIRVYCGCDPIAQEPAGCHIVVINPPGGGNKGNDDIYATCSGLCPNPQQQVCAAKIAQVPNGGGAVTLTCVCEDRQPVPNP